MKKTTIGWLIAAAFLILIGGMIFTGVMSMLKFDFRQLSVNRFETNRYDLKEPVQRIAVETMTADIVFIPSERDTASVECHEQTNIRHTVKVENGTLVITVHDTRKWYEHISFFNIEGTKVTVALPKGVYDAVSVDTTTGNVSIPQDFGFETMTVTATTGNVNCEASVNGIMTLHLTTGDITLANTRAGSADLSVTTGHISANAFTCDGELSVKVGTGDAVLTDVTCASLTSSGTTGDLHLENVVASDTFTVKRTTGDVRFDRCDAAAITVNITTGDVAGTLLTDKTFVADSTTGHVDVPQTTGGMCSITSTTGDIDIDIVK